MIDRHRIVAAACGVLAVGAAVAFPATAVADDLPPDPLPAPGDPAPPPPPGPTVPVIGAAGSDGSRRAGAEQRAARCPVHSVHRRSSASTPTACSARTRSPSAPGGGTGTPCRT